MKNLHFENEYSSLATYLKEVEKVSVLSREEEYDLACKAKSGDLVARDKLITANSRFVISIAKQYQNRGLSLEDLISEGNVGLIMAVDKFEPEKGFHFISYAVWWIRQSILKALAEKTRMVRIPMNKINDKDSYVDVCSLDVPVGDEDGQTFGDFMESDEKPEDDVLNKIMSEQIKKVLSAFSEKERDIIVRRYGLYDNKPMSLKEVGDIYGLTKERIRQIEKKMLTNLSENSTVKDMREYLAQ